MLEEHDINKIGEIVQKAVKEEVGAAEKRIVDNIVGQVGEMIEQNVLPQIKALDDKVTNLPDKDFVTTAVDGAYGRSVARDKTLMEKTNAIAETLGRKNVFTPSDVAAIRQIRFAQENQ